jgi:hypothetical protein
VKEKEKQPYPANTQNSQGAKDAQNPRLPTQDPEKKERGENILRHNVGNYLTRRPDEIEIEGCTNKAPNNKKENRRHGS